MPCCWADKSGVENWCKNEPTEKVADGKEYCIFHAPKESSEWTKEKIDEFNQNVFAKIDEAIRNKEGCDLAGTIFPGDIDFSKYNKDNPLSDISFYYATFSGKANLTKATFSGKAGFRRATFISEAIFWDATFSDGAWFQEATFRSGTWFQEAIFSGEVDFGEATFSGGANFRDATFSGRAVFFKATFSDEANFKKATFNDGAWFQEATFSGGALFQEASFSGEADFRKVTFSDRAWFQEATFRDGADFSYTKIKDETNFQEVTFSGEANFKKASFSGEAVFKKVTFSGGLSFKEATFGGYRKAARFIKCKFGKVDFNGEYSKAGYMVEGDSLENIPLDAVNIESFRFINCEWPNDTDGRKIIVVKKDGTVDTKQLEDIYRHLKKKAKEDHDEIMASAWHYKERKMCRINLETDTRTWNESFVLFFLILYDNVSGFGEDLVRALIFFCLLLFLPGILIADAAQIANLQFNISSSLDLDSVIKASLEYMPLTKIDVPKKCLLEYIFKLFYQLVITLQAALLAFAIRNKFRR